jgi:cytidine deaminase
MHPTPDHQHLLQAAHDAARHAYAPYSRFRVGAALLDADGHIWTGCNIENASYGLTICAERVAITKAISEGVAHFTAIAIVASGTDRPMPCGACRQVLQEFCTTDMPVIVASDEKRGAATQFTLAELLPHPFSLDKQTSATSGDSL